MVARVDGVPVTEADLDRTIKVGALSGQTLSRKAGLEQLISEVLIRREAERLHVSVPQRTLDERVRQVADSVGGEAALERQLNGAKLSMREFRRGLEAVLVGERLQAVKFKDKRATRAEARAFYADNRAMFRQGPSVKLGAIPLRRETHADDVRRRVEQGTPFETAAAQFGIDPQLRAERGMMGWVQVASLPGSLRKVLKGAEAGALLKAEAKPLWYVLKVYGRRPAKVTSFAAVAADLQNELTRQKQSEALAAWVKEARARARVEVF